MEPCAARVAPLANVDVPPQPGRIRFYPRMINPSIPLQLQQTGDENRDRPGRYLPARCGNPNPTGWLLIGWGLWNQRAARVASRASAEVPPHQGKISSHPRIRNPSISLQLHQPGDENVDLSSPGSISSHKVWKPQPKWLGANWLRLIEQAPGESCLSRQPRGPAAPGEDRVLFPD